ncbi:hypothetical protein NJB1907f44_11540 [Mycobacterium marinum]|nr:hypothetical protein DSM43519_03399 [Mycobacterium marinum]GJO85365.1 hypothetical protein NJB1907f44_11540 [Mycobacterium marinum]GJO97649.1 hypothetical protein NJB18001_08700 [Mycobacterium marinum]
MAPAACALAVPTKDPIRARSDAAAATYSGNTFTNDIPTPTHSLTRAPWASLASPDFEVNGVAHT